MAYTVRWEQTKVKKLISSMTVKDESKASGRRSVPTYAPEPYVMQYPVVRADSTQDIVAALGAILEQKVPGFHSVRNILEHINYGLYQSPVVKLRRGYDPKLSPAQSDALKMYASLIPNGMAERDDVVAILTRQGIEDAGSLLDAMIAAQGMGDEEDDSAA